MNPTKRMCDLLGRTNKLQLAVLKLLTALLVIPGSAWPSQARSMGASYDIGSGTCQQHHPLACGRDGAHRAALCEDKDVDTPSWCGKIRCHAWQTRVPGHVSHVVRCCSLWILWRHRWQQWRLRWSRWYGRNHDDRRWRWNKRGQWWDRWCGRRGRARRHHQREVSGVDPAGR